jgi:hypothetical protein
MILDLSSRSETYANNQHGLDGFNMVKIKGLTLAIVRAEPLNALTRMGVEIDSEFKLTRTPTTELTDFKVENRCVEARGKAS